MSARNRIRSSDVARDLTVATLAAAALVGVIMAAPAPATAQTDLEGKPAPDLVLKTPAGKTIDLADLKGKLVVVDFWATWCGPCLQEMPEYNRIYKEFSKRNDGFELLGVALASGDEQDFKEWLDEGPEILYPVGLGADSVARTWGGVTVVPTTFVIGSDGKVLKRIEGATAEKLAYIEETVKKYTASPPGDQQR